MQCGHKLSVKVMPLAAETAVFRMADIDDHGDPPEQSMDRLDGKPDLFLAIMGKMQCNFGIRIFFGQNVH
ncbi:hypothetical protein DPMN_183746 [Dreissena polymorpha]|uniref:Uncharacterized protein n=1 Tax=Dreissena polymorpha TaxID=45954 RepID=A0A9D4DHY5_DREPO|nr:hypothetical protein DPMN_183746 [Dreissena polymorpha]